MRRIMFVAVVCAFMSGAVQAQMFEQTINVPGNQLVVEYDYDGRSATHNLSLATPAVDVSGLDVVTSATLTLAFQDNESCGLGLVNK